MTKGRGRPRNERIRKIYCEIIEGAVYEDRCLWRLEKMIENNEICENCVLRELEKIKSCREAEPIKNVAQEIKYFYNICDLASFLKKSDQTIRNWVKKGRIPGRKVGRKWELPKEEIDQWLSQKGNLYGEIKSNPKNEG